MPLGADAPPVQVHRLQRRRDGAGQLQGPLPDRAATRTCCSRACSSPATRSRRRPATSSCAPSTTSRYAAARAGDRRGPRPRLPRRATSSARASASTSHLHVSIGRYMCGEASAHAERPARASAPNPRARPPHMASAGLWSRPTVVNNVETLCCVPGDRAARRRTLAAPWAVSDEGGTQASTASPAASRRTGLPGSCPMGTPMREVIEEHAGGMRDGFELRAVLPGRRLDAVRAGRRPSTSPWTSTTMKAGRQPPGHRHACLLDDQTAARSGMTPQPDAVLRPGVVRLVHALPGRAAVDGRHARPTSRRAAGAPSTSTCWPSTSGS